VALRTRGYAHRVDIVATPATVWSALTEEAHLARWMNPDARIKARAGGSLYVMPSPGLARDALIDLFEPARRMRLIFLPPAGLTEFEGAVVEDYLLEAEGDHTIVRLLGSGMPELPDWDHYFRQVRTAQERSMARLKVMSEKLQREGQ